MRKQDVAGSAENREMNSVIRLYAFSLLLFSRRCGVRACFFQNIPDLGGKRCAARGGYNKYLFYGMYPAMWAVLAMIKFFV